MKQLLMKTGLTPKLHTLYVICYLRATHELEKKFVEVWGKRAS